MGGPRIVFFSTGDANVGGSKGKVIDSFAGVLPSVDVPRYKRALQKPPVPPLPLVARHKSEHKPPAVAYSQQQRGAVDVNSNEPYDRGVGQATQALIGRGVVYGGVPHCDVAHEALLSIDRYLRC